MLTRYGTDNIVVMLVIGALLLGFSFFLDNKVIQIPIAIIATALIVFTFVFFRNPTREVPEEYKNKKGIILSPADGTVKEIVEIYEEDFIKGKAKQISIFLSPLNVHVNRIPATGTIEDVKYQKGKFLAAYKFEASTENEMSIIKLTTPEGKKIIFKQIVGALARRIVYDVKSGDEVKAGELFGMMKFGSRMDIIVPMDTEIVVKPNDIVKGGQTLLGKMN
jgi:phosphatidylserine decarboxylase